MIVLYENSIDFTALQPSGLQGVVFVRGSKIFSDSSRAHTTSAILGHNFCRPIKSTMFSSSLVACRWRIELISATVYFYESRAACTVMVQFDFYHSVHSVAVEPLSPDLELLSDEPWKAAVFRSAGSAGVARGDPGLMDPEVFFTAHEGEHFSISVVCFCMRDAPKGLSCQKVFT